jgi:hypothetical protein
MKFFFPVFAAGLVGLAGSQCRAVIFASTGDPAFNTTAPTGALLDSGWQFQGLWGNFLGTPIAPQFFITAEHILGNVGDLFSYQGQSYVTDAVYDDPNSDLRIWHVTTPFPNFAPLYLNNNETGKELVVFGRGTQRGGEVTFAGNPRGWLWGAADGVPRWGTNTVNGFLSGGGSIGSLLVADFDLSGPATEAHLSVGDSGGAVFIKDTDNIWKLAGINYAVSGPYYTSSSGAGEFQAALHNEAGFFVSNGGGGFVPASGPGEFYSTRISSNATFITQTTGIPEPSTALALIAGAALGGTLCRIRRREGRPQALEV